MSAYEIKYFNETSNFEGEEYVLSQNFSELIAA